jgi:hypothetical protein
MTIRLLESWLAVVVVATMVLGCSAEQRLPVAVTVDSTIQNLQWTDAGGLLEGEIPRVLRRDVLGPDTYLVGAITGKVPGSGTIKSLEGFRFEKSPLECQES